MKRFISALTVLLAAAVLCTPVLLSAAPKKGEKVKNPFAADLKKIEKIEKEIEKAEDKDDKKKAKSLAEKLEKAKEKLSKKREKICKQYETQLAGLRKKLEKLQEKGKPEDIAKLKQQIAYDKWYLKALDSWMEDAEPEEFDPSDFDSDDSSSEEESEE